VGQRARTSNAFGTFLTTVQRQGSAAAHDEQEGADTVVALRLLIALLDQGPRMVQDLQRELDLDIFDFARILSQLREAGLVETSGSNGSELVELTRTGKSLAELQQA
jgi:DNA-binding MarR family transcriptional regulator